MRPFPTTPMPMIRLSIFILALAAGVPAGPARLVAQSPATTELLAAAKASHSDALYLWKDGKVIGDWTLGNQPGPIEMMSAFKSVVALGIGRLLETGKLDSLDQPVHTLYPEWSQGRKKLITIRHLLDHTSGLQNVPNAGAEIYPAPNAIALALAAELSDDPGSRFSYNNKAVNLLAGVIERASGLRMDLYLQDELFAPLGISRYQWYFDRSGNPHAMAGLQLEARDVAKFGILVLDRGVWNGKRLLGDTFLTDLVKPGPLYPLVGLLWWIQVDTQTVALRRPLPTTKHAGKLEALVGKTFGSRRDASEAVFAAVGPGADTLLAAELGPRWPERLFDWKVGKPVAWYADGYLGQYLVVVPGERVVAVRQVRNKDGYDQKTDGFMTFPAMVARLAASFR